ncbi:FUSC family protein [Flexivirga lutea]
MSRRGPLPADLVHWRRLVAGATGDAWQRVRTGGWPVIQGTFAATVSWVIARHLVQHHQPFFAPIAAVVALNTHRGERGTNAVRLLLGVILGIVVAEGAVEAMGAGYVTLAVATVVSMLLALVLGAARMVIAQSAASAILTVATNSPGVGPARLIDALIGGGVALVISQLLFPAAPLKLLHQDESAALAGMAQALHLAGAAIEHGDDTPADRAVEQLRSVRDRLTELGKTRQLTLHTARRTPRWWVRRGPIVREEENAGQLDLLGSSCLALTRAIIAADDTELQSLRPAIGQLGDVLQGLAAAPSDRDVRQDAADRAVRIARGTRQLPADAPEAARAVAWSLRQVAHDTIVFAGIDPGQASDAVTGS